MNINKETIQEHCKRKAAQIIHDTMECEEPRSAHDWFAACRIIEASPSIVRAAIRLIEDHCRNVNRDADPNHVGTFTYVCALMLWENVREPRYSIAGKPPFGKIIFH